MSNRARRRAVAATTAVAALCGVVAAVRATTPAPALAQQGDPPAVGRIAFAGTGHRGIGVVADPVPDPPADRPAVSEPLAGPGPAHFDDHVSARGDLVVFTSLRDERRPQVYLRAADGSVRRLTTGRDAGHPQLSPDLRTVVFDSAEDGQRDLWVVGVDGSGARRLTDGPADETWPTFSPDGAQVAFSADRDGEPELYRQPVAGGAAVRLTDEPSGAAVEPAWNPRDGRIAYTLDRGPAAPAQLRVLDGAGLGVPVLGGDQAGWRGRWPAWKPDGSGLLFLSQDQTCSCPADPEVTKVYQVDTGYGLPVTAPPGLLLAEDRHVSSPAWSGAGAPALLVSRTTAATRSTATLQDVRPDGVDPRDLGVAVLREDPGSVEDPNLLFYPREGYDPWTQRQSYSPDGRRIAVTRFEELEGRRVQRLWLVDADGGDPRRVPVADRAAEDWEFDPAWSPDGRFIAFARRSPGGVPGRGGPSRIAVVEVATGAVVGNLRPPPEVAEREDTQPAWSPDGATLAFTRGVISDPGTPGEVRDNHIWTARAGTLDRQRDLSAAVCGSDCRVTDDSAAFRPDGAAVVFNREFDGLVEVSLRDDRCRVLQPRGQGGCSTPLTAPPTGPFQPRDAAHSPDGDRIAVTARRQGDARSPEELVVHDPAGGGLDRITRDLPGRQKEPTWQPSVDLAVQAPPTVPDLDSGGSTTTTVTVLNRGPATSPGTALTAAVPEGVRVDVLRPDRGSCDAATPRCDLGALEGGASVRVEVVLVGLTPGRRRVTWSVTGGVLDVRPSDNSAQTQVRRCAPPPRAPGGPRPRRPRHPRRRPPAPRPRPPAPRRPPPRRDRRRAAEPVLRGRARDRELHGAQRGRRAGHRPAPGLRAARGGAGGGAATGVHGGRLRAARPHPRRCAGRAGGLRAGRAPGDHRARRPADLRDGRRPRRQHRHRAHAGAAAAHRGRAADRRARLRDLRAGPGLPARRAGAADVVARHHRGGGAHDPARRRRVRRAAAGPGQGPDRAAHHHRDRARFPAGHHAVPRGARFDRAARHGAAQVRTDPRTRRQS
ncbi:PD40 domain-containing protein [Saccharothrix algeriensis]|uniref:PD40 domain-containing protein n=1 Tax=Saccharothrix algeriensis TaxID=173560 RepID=A0A8T8HXP8_9PSEU|nr:PD40 domain-containing protein [Saccharothrix algeriensis]